MSTDTDSLVTDEMRAGIGRTSPIRTLPEEIRNQDSFLVARVTATSAKMAASQYAVAPAEEG